MKCQTLDAILLFIFLRLIEILALRNTDDEISHVIGLHFSFCQERTYMEMNQYLCILFCYNIVLGAKGIYTGLQLFKNARSYVTIDSRISVWWCY